MKKIFVDTSAWYALLDNTEPEHNKAAAFLNENKIPLVTSNYVFDEIVTLALYRLGFNVASEFGKNLKQSKFVDLIRVSDNDEERAWEIFLKYSDQDLSFTDCTSFAIMDRLRIDHSFTLDSHFKMMNYSVLPV